MLSLFRTASFKKDYKKLSNTNKTLLKEIIIKLQMKEKLEKKYKDHKLIGNYSNCRECHIKPDLLLIYKINDNILELGLVRVGNHSDLF